MKQPTPTERKKDALKEAWQFYEEHSQPSRVVNDNYRPVHSRLWNRLQSFGRYVRGVRQAHKSLKEAEFNRQFNDMKAHRKYVREITKGKK